MKRHDVQKIKDEIIMSALVHVPFDGWCWDVIEQAAKDAAYEPEMARAVFPDKMIDVLDGFADWADREMLRNLSDVNAQDLRVRDRVKEAVFMRYKVLNSHKESVRLSAQFWLHPLHKMRAAKIIWRTADCVWGWAGDTATDYNRYTKRGLLSSILVPTTLAWLSDDSQDMRVTEGFLERRIENVLQLGKIVGRFTPQKKRAS